MTPPNALQSADKTNKFLNKNGETDCIKRNSVLQKGVTLSLSLGKQRDGIMQSLFSDKDDQLRSSFTNQGSSFPRTPSEYMTYNAYSHVPSEMGSCTIALIRFSSVIAAFIIFHFCMYSDDTMLLNPLAKDFIPNIFNPSNI